MSAEAPLRIAVVGHTNAGKTSLMRTLTRDVGFGDVSERPATTRHVEGAALLLGDAAAVELFDTPGLEDSIALLEHLEALRAAGRADRPDVVRAFLDGPEAAGRFEQEAKALRWVLASDAAFYVVDARDRVHGKYRDELEILAWCARPVVPVLNFVAGAEARTAEWREQLTRVNMHAIAEFDTVVLNETAEQRLFEKLATLLDARRPVLESLIADRRRRRAELVRAAARLLAELLLDVAAYRVVVPAAGRPGAAEVEPLRRAVRSREHFCVAELLELFRFRSEDYEVSDLPIADGRWGLDLFSPVSLKQFGIRTGRDAVVGGLAGLTIDAMTGGLSLGAAAALGASAGALWSGFRSHGRRLADRLRGFTELRVSDATLRLLAIRQIDLVQALLRRGHASMERIRLTPEAEAVRRDWARRRLPAPLQEARANPGWSRLDAGGAGSVAGDAGRQAALAALARLLEENVTAPPA